MDREKSEQLMRSTHGCHDTINYQVRELHRLSKAFIIVGNRDMAKTLDEIADSIADCSATISGNESERLNTYFQESQRQVTTTLSALAENV